MASVRFKGVTKRFGEHVAVDGLDLEVDDREFLVLLGPSGCGKTTTLRLLAGLEEPTHGEIYIGDRLVNKVEPKERDIAMVFQSYALYPHMSVYDNMAFGLRLRKMTESEINRRVKQTADILGLEELLDRKPRQLSGGQRQRVAVGRAIVREPQVFLMDEPLSNLDAKLRVRARAELWKLHERLGATFVYVTHDQTEAMTMGTRIAVQKDGVLQQLDTPQALYERPANLFVAGFIGSPAMNFFDASLGGSDRELYIDAESFRLRVPEGRVSSLRTHLGKHVILGIRPEDVHDSDFAPQGIGTAKVCARVDVTEPMGNEVFLYLLSGDESFTARVDPRTKARVGQDMELLLNVDNMHLFDPETEAILL